MTDYTPEEQAQNRKQWVTALRSDDYVQATGRLRDGDRFCCLGVACDISGLAEWEEGNRYLEEKETLPQQVRDWLGLENAAGGYIASSLSNLNDTRVSFDEIADMIESEPRGLLA